MAYDERNPTLIDCLHSTGSGNFTTGWDPLFEGKALFTTFAHQQWVKWVGGIDTSGRWKNWLDYVEKRYQLGVNDQET